MVRYMGDSLNKIGDLSYGYATNKTFIRLIEQLLDYQNAQTWTKFTEKIVASFYMIIHGGGEFKFAPYQNSIEILCALADKLASDPAKYFAIENCGKKSVMKKS